MDDAWGKNLPDWESDNITNIFKVATPNPKDIEKLETIQYFGQQLASIIIDVCEESKEREIAIERVQEACMWANEAIARYGNP